MNIPMVDLRSQYLKIKEEVDSKIFNVLDTTAFINGDDVKMFRNELANYLNVKHAITCGNGTDALQIAMMALGLQPGDEVISTDFTFIATVETIALLKLTPVMVDVDPDTFCIDPDKIEKAISPRTKAIMPVHLFGQCADMDRIMEIAEKYNLYVIEDTAQAIGSDFTSDKGWTKKAGTIGHIGCTSFFPSKNLGCYGDGGAIFTNDDELSEKMNSIVNHGMEIRYYHDRIGVNSRLDTIQAAVLRVKLPLLDEYNLARLSAADYYDKAFANCDKIITPKRFNKSTHTFHQYTVQLNNVDREGLQAYLKSKGIASAVYYPVALHNQKAFKGYKYDPNGFAVTNQLCKTVLSLPINTELDNDTLKYITDNVLSFINSDY
ncbi:MAG: DegT/DnrJ/EryC1/StrS family aminotransferase [Bacteroidales bacterium]|nr:DegT/DnrJ/EryC1/StrS family aminotransferase [Bacteroidales bacterium]